MRVCENGGGKKDEERKTYRTRRRVYWALTTGLAIVVGEKVLIDRVRFAHKSYSCRNKGNADD